MEPFTWFLLSMQAAGLIYNLNEAQTKQQQIQQGRQLEKAAIDANLEALNVESQESSIAAMKQLRSNLGTQIVTNAARGTRQGTETTVANAQKSVSAYNADGQTRRMNLLAKEANLRAQNVLSGLHTMQSETQLGQQTAKLFTDLPLSSSVDQFRRSSLGKKWGFGLEQTA